MDEFKLIVAGGRDFSDYERLSQEIDKLALVELKDKRVSIVSGMARGADSLALQFARVHNVKVYQFYADWDKYGKSAGHRRNRQMGDFADDLLAFWDGQSKGTKGMIDYMKSLAKPVRVIKY